MPLPQLQPLLQYLDQTNHADRLRTMALLGRDHADDPGLSVLLDSLAAESSYHQRLALAAAPDDDGRIAAALSHPSPTVRSFALTRLNPASVSAEAVLEAILHGSADDRRNLQGYVNRHRLTTVAEAVIHRLRDEFGDRAAAGLLATCTADTVRRLLPEMFHAVPNLRTLARRHPIVLLDFLEAELDGLSRSRRDELWRHSTPATSELALAEPDQFLRLVENHGPSWILPPGISRVLASMIRFDAARIARLLVIPACVTELSRNWRLPRALTRSAPLFAFDDQVALARALREHDHLFRAWLGALAPSRRAAVFAGATEDLSVDTRVWAPPFLEVLPHELRHAEARRILALRAIGESARQTLTYTAFLPFAEARDSLVASTRRADAEERALGYEHLIACAGRERSVEVMGEALMLCDRLRNEQDPVRHAAIRALAAAPPAQFDGEVLTALQPLALALTEARDTSWGSLHQLTILAVRLLVDAADAPESPRFHCAITLLNQIIDRNGSLLFPPLIRLLPPEAESSLVAALTPRMRQTATRDDYQVLFPLLRILGRRAWRHEELQRLLETATRAASDTAVHTALRHWLSDPRNRAARVARVLAADESSLAVPAVLEAVVLHEQHLLDILLRPRRLKGRFLAGTTRFVPVIRNGLHRWLPRQVESYRQDLDLLIATPATSDATRTDAIGALARLPQIGVAALETSLASSEVRIQEAALGGLAWTDEPGSALASLL
ncbi:MAG: hypothetical protein ACK5LS_14185, partial [Propioniciclava sp.]